MTAQEKAKELVEKFAQFAQADWDDLNGYNKRQELANAKQCALIGVELAIEGLVSSGIENMDSYNYLQQVKQEIKNI